MPPTTTPSEGRSDSVTLRIKPEERGLIDRAAQLANKTRTNFVLEAARKAAEEAILDRAVLHVSPEAYKTFLARLDAPARPNKRLKAALSKPAPWENG